MKQTRLTSFLTSLSRNEMKTFGEFISSPVFNKNNLMLKLYEAYNSFYPDLEEPSLTNEWVFEHVFGKKQIDYFKLKNLESDLLALGKEFLTFLRYRQDDKRRDTDLLAELRKRELKLIFESAFRLTEKKLNSETVKDEKWLLHKMNLSDEQVYFSVPFKPELQLNRLQEKMNNTADYSVMILLRNYNLILHDQQQFNVTFDLKLFEQVTGYLRDIGGHTNPTIQLLYLMVMLNIEKNDENFRRLYDHRKKHKDEISIMDNYYAFLLLDGYCAYCYNNFSRTDLLREQFELTRECDINHFPELGKVLYPDFVYSVKIAARVGEIEYAEDYIERFKKNLTAEKVNTINFCKAIILFCRENYDEALEHLARVNFSDFILKIQVKLLILQTIISKEDYEQARPAIDSFRHYLSREKLLMSEHKAALLEFLKITVEMIGLATSANPSRNAKQGLELQARNLAKNFLGIKLWLISKLEKM
ncbi:MAG: hypothetical protein K1X85_11645 [Ignavibacteria bacterium]|nr:hypothetical protein [Ignavibacteria bacterium]